MQRMVSGMLLRQAFEMSHSVNTTRGKILRGESLFSKASDCLYYRRIYKSKGWMMLKDIKRSDLPKNPMPVPDHVMKFPIVWEKPPPAQEKTVVRRNILSFTCYDSTFRKAVVALV